MGDIMHKYIIDDKVFETSQSLAESFANLEAASLKIKAQRDDLLEALKKVQDWFELCGTTEHSLGRTVSKAIAKAEGQS